VAVAPRRSRMGSTPAHGSDPGLPGGLPGGRGAAGDGGHPGRARGRAAPHGGAAPGRTGFRWPQAAA
jgi:hypothetical protein